MLQGTRGGMLSRLSSTIAHRSNHHGIQLKTRLASLHPAVSRPSGRITPFRQVAFKNQACLLTTTIPPPPSNSNKWPRRFRILLYILLFSYLGSMNASLVMKMFSDPIVEPDSPEDVEITTALNSHFDKLEIVKKLRADPAYTEWEPYGNLTEEERRPRLTSGCLRGSRGVSCQHVFYNSQEKILTSVLFLGNALDGWPTVVHGGAIATLLDENMGRVAIENLPERTGVTANLNITYKAPLSPGQYISVEAKFNPALSSGRKVVVEAVIKDQAGRVCSEATALFVYPKKLKLRTIGEKF